MKIAGFIPVGPLDRMGYQYISGATLARNAAVLDCLYVLSSTPQTTSLPYTADNIRLISDERSWSATYEGDEERFNMLEDKNPYFLFELAKDDGYDFLINIHINQYFDDFGASGLYDYAAKLLRYGADFGYVWKSYQIGETLCLPDKRLPWLVNLHSTKSMKFIPDGLEISSSQLYIKSGIFLSCPYYIVDVDGLLTEEDCTKRWEYFEKYLVVKSGEEGSGRSFEVESLYRFDKMNSKIEYKKISHETSLTVAKCYSKGSMYNLNIRHRESGHYINRKSIWRRLFECVLKYIFIILSNLSIKR